MAKYKVGYDLKALTEEPKEKNTYIFPSKLAKMMNKVDLRVQLEASMLSLTFLMVGMILYSIYLAIYGGMNIWMKVFIIFNSICGMILMSTYLITNFQQYKNFMDTMGIDSEHEKKKIKERYYYNRSARSYDSSGAEGNGHRMDSTSNYDQRFHKAYTRWYGLPC